ncbi:MAG TPA: hypothetical protein VGI39_08235 [Polyangiaceae bacterium]
MHSSSGVELAAPKLPSHRIVASVVALLALGVVTLFSAPARADGRTENAARGLEQKAMQEDYLATDFDKALEKLNSAIGKCGTERCSSIVRAQLKRDVGVVQIAKQNREAAVAAFAEALRADSNVVLDPDTRTKDVDAAWNEAKKQAGAGGGAATGGGGGAPPAGDFTVNRAAQTLVRTPLPIYAEYTGSETLAKVVLKYKAFGMGEWKTLEMKPMDKAWGAEIPCLDVVGGDILYYVQGFNAANDPVATSGDRNNPFKTTAKANFSGDLPHFPGKAAPSQCQDTGDCPPDFPGCKKPVAPSSGDEGTAESSLKSEGEDCESDDQCASGTCNAEKTCGAGTGNKKFRRWWIGLDLQLDFVPLPGADKVCLLTDPQATPVNTAGYYCYYGGDFPSRTNRADNQQIDPNHSDRVAGGYALGTFRAMASLDYAINTHLLTGVRLGYAFNGYPGVAGGAFPPVHAEARVTYIFGDQPLAKKGPGIYLSFGAGVTQFAANVSVSVIRLTTNQATVVQAWDFTGPGFAALGAGLRYALSNRAAFMLGGRATAGFGNATFVPILSPELSFQYGL